MQFSAICTECKEMFLFTDNLLYVRPILLSIHSGRAQTIKPLCFRCSTIVGACLGVSLRATEVCGKVYDEPQNIIKKDREGEEDDPTLSDSNSEGGSKLINMKTKRVKMTITQFYKELSEHKQIHRGKWIFESSALLQISKDNITYNKRVKNIRIYSNIASYSACPITAMARIHGHHHTVDDWEDAAKDLGLSQKDASEITKASDQIDGYSKVIRNKLLRATGLDES